MDDLKIGSALVIGSGTMGSGIAQWLAQQRVRVGLSDISQDQVKQSIKNIHASWERLEQKGKFDKNSVQDFKDSLYPCDLENFPQQTDLAIEAVVENKKIKIEVFKKLEDKLSNCILATNTSSIPISSMQKELKKRDLFLGLHFFNPAPVMKLVEVIKGKWTPNSLCIQLKDWFDKKGKKGAICKDSPGFIVNRVVRNFYGEAFRIVGEEDPQKIQEHDRVMKEVGGFRMGPFELMDIIGIDINYEVTKSVWKDFYHEPRFAPHSIQRKMVEEGRLGKKTGEGFYPYE